MNDVQFINRRYMIMIKNVFCKVNITDLVPTLLGAYFANTARPPVATR